MVPAIICWVKETLLVYIVLFSDRDPSYVPANTEQTGPYTISNTKQDHILYPMQNRTIYYIQCKTGSYNISNAKQDQILYPMQNRTVYYIQCKTGPYTIFNAKQDHILYSMQNRTIYYIQCKTGQYTISNAKQDRILYSMQHRTIYYWRSKKDANLKTIFTKGTATVHINGKCIPCMFSLKDGNN